MTAVDQQVKTHQRRDVQGLRAVAVIAVVLTHLFEWPSGGFIGVDVFFVISGFLITGLLLREYRRTGRISFSTFYRRRIRRIIPIAVVVIGFTTLAAFLLLNSSRGRSVADDGLWALFFAANWHFAASGTDYWQTDGIVSPLQHYWSLAVEEQFYVAWPWVIIIVLGLLRRGTQRWSGRGNMILFVVFAALAGASFAFALWQTTAQPMWAYFSTFTRAWELAAGALIAVAVPWLGRIPKVGREVLGVVGLAGIIASVFLIAPDSGVPAPATAFAVAAAALVIVSGIGGEQRSLFVLTNPVAQYVGTISYSLYLWHFPVIMLLPAFFPQRGTLYAAVALTVMTGLSVVSFHLLEDPIRRSRWLEKPLPGQDRWISRNRQPLRQLGYLGIAVHGAVTLVVVAALTINPPGNVSTARSAEAISAVPDAVGVPTVSDADSLGSSIDLALAMQEFPELTPSVNELGTETWIGHVNETGCADVSSKTIGQCITGTEGATRTAVVLGDSYAIAWMAGIRAALEPAGYSVQALTRGQCPAANVTVTKDGGESFPECGEHREWALRTINEKKPDLVILADADNTLDRLVSGSSEEAGTEAIRTGMSSTIAAIEGSGSRIVVLAPPPEGKNLQECVTNFGSPSDCTRGVSTRWQLFRDASKVAAETSGAEYIDTLQWFCSDAGDCPGFVDGIPVRTDTSHLTIAYSTFLGPHIAAAIIPKATPPGEQEKES